jgi:hypothetical protein
MPTSDHDEARTQLYASLEPLAVRMPEAERISGLSRSEIYRRAGRREILILKCGRSSLVDVASLKAVMASLPRAQIRSPR